MAQPERIWTVPSDGLPIVSENFGANKKASRAAFVSEKSPQPGESKDVISPQTVTQYPEWTVIRGRPIEETFAEDKGRFRGARGRLPSHEGRAGLWDPDLMVD